MNMNQENEGREYIVQCFNCLGEFDAVQSVWCHHDPQNPTKICPFCLNCFCQAPAEYHKQFWESAPESLRREHESFRKSRHPLGNLLVHSGLITMEQMLNALAIQTRTGEKLGEILIRLGLLHESELELFLKLQKYDVPSPLKSEHIHLMALQKLTPEFCLENHIAPLEFYTTERRSFVVVACVNRTQTDVMEAIRDMLTAHPVPFLAPQDEIDSAVRNFVTTKKGADETEAFSAGKWLARLLSRALSKDATDILIDPSQNVVQVRARIDGVLYDMDKLDKAYYPRVVRRILKFHGLTPGSLNEPIRGEKQISVRGREYKLQTLLLPGADNPSIMMKLINVSSFLKDISELGFIDFQLKQIQTALSRSTGLIVVSGPPMHGTTTTEYAFLQYLQKFNKRIVTIETPVQMRLPGIQHIDIDPVHGKDVRSTLQDVILMEPEVVYVSSVPNQETMKLILDYSASVLMIIDFNAMSVWEVLRWFQEHQFPAFLVSQRMNCIMNQRLVRKICESCRYDSSLQKGLLLRLGLTRDEVDEITPYEGAGCEQCNFIGYRGRVPIFEILLWTPELATLWDQQAPLETLIQEALRQGYLPMRKVCLRKISEGLTTVDELQRWNIRDPLMKGDE